MADAALSVRQRLHLLISDYALDLVGRPDGLTGPELRRAWSARHGGAVPRSALTDLQNQGLVYKLRERRTCVVSGEFRGAYLPCTMRGTA